MAEYSTIGDEMTMSAMNNLELLLREATIKERLVDILEAHMRFRTVAPIGYSMTPGLTEAELCAMDDEATEYEYNLCGSIDDLCDALGLQIARYVA